MKHKLAEEHNNLPNLLKICSSSIEVLCSLLPSDVKTIEKSAIELIYEFNQINKHFETHKQSIKAIENMPELSELIDNIDILKTNICQEIDIHAKILDNMTDDQKKLSLFISRLGHLKISLGEIITEINSSAESESQTNISKLNAIYQEISELENETNHFNNKFQNDHNIIINYFTLSSTKYTTNVALQIQNLLNLFNKYDLELHNIIKKAKTEEWKNVGNNEKFVILMQYQDRLSQHIESVVDVLHYFVQKFEEIYNLEVDNNVSPDLKEIKMLLEKFKLGELKQRFIQDLISKHVITSAEEIGYKIEPETIDNDNSVDLF